MNEDLILYRRQKPLSTRRVPTNVCVKNSFITTLFPPNWQNLCAVKFSYFYQTNSAEVAWNPHHPIMRAVDESSWTWCLDKFKTSYDPLPHREEILTNKGRVAAWIILCLQKGEKYLWDGIKDRDTSFLSQVWQILFDIPVENRLAMLPPILEWVEDSPDSRLRVLTPEGWDVCQEGKKIKQYLPDPGLEWRIVDKDREEQRKDIDKRQAELMKRVEDLTVRKSTKSVRAKKRK